MSNSAPGPAQGGGALDPQANGGEARAPRLVRFGVFEADLRTGELRKQGLKVRLQDQPFRLLGMLLQKPDELVTKEEIKRELWPDTFIDVDHAISVAINRIRDALDDPADNPRFVESVARRGYRFIAPVQTIDPARLAAPPVNELPAALPAVVPYSPERERALVEHLARTERELAAHRRDHQQERAEWQARELSLEATSARLEAELEALHAAHAHEHDLRLAASAAHRRESGRRALLLWSMIALLTAASIALVVAIHRTPRSADFHRITYRRGTIVSARFVKDGNTVVYGAAWDGGPIELFTTRPDVPESRALGLDDTEILSISTNGEMALLQHPRYEVGITRSGTLARMPVTGGAPRPLLDGVEEADWNPAGTDLAIARSIAGRDRLEYPIGKVLYETAGFISNLRFSPRGEAIAFLDHPLPYDDAGWVAEVDLSGKKTTLSTLWLSARGLDWSPDGREVWVTATHSGIARGLYAVPSRGGSERLVTRVPGTLTLLDAAHDGRVMLTQSSPRFGIVNVSRSARARELSWHDYSVATSVSEDGQTLLFNELGEGGGARYSVFIRRMDGSPAVRLGDGLASDLSPDGQWVVSKRETPSGERLWLLPLGAGEARPLPAGPIIFYHWASWLPDGRTLVVAGNQPGHAVRLWLQSAGGAAPVAISPEGVRYYWNAVSPDGRSVMAIDPQRQLHVYALDGKHDVVVPGGATGYEPMRWSRDGRSLFVHLLGEVPARLYQLDVATGQMHVIRELPVADPVGLLRVFWPQVNAAGEPYVYTYYRALTDLYIADELK